MKRAAAPALCASGNAARDGERGWFIGQFVAPRGGLRRRRDVEVKWGVHARGERRRAWAAYRTSTTIAVLIEGQCVITVREGARTQTVHLREPGDYVVIPPVVEHLWEAPLACIVVTIRTPSVAGDLIEPR